MTARHVVLMLGAAALMQPPVAVEARVLTLRACGGAAHRSCCRATLPTLRSGATAPRRVTRSPSVAANR